MAATTILAQRENTYTFYRPGKNDVTGGLPRFKVGMLELGATADNADTVAVDMFARWGITRLLAVIGFIHTTANSVIVEEAPVTVNDGTLLTLTVGGSTANKQRFYVVYGI